ncbi:MAG: PAS domain S-box protein [Thermodesulfobacteriota bacterium]|nr:PAS domain S-box protein [Thermodesulfobacteriota bacterium]
MHEKRLSQIVHGFLVKWLLLPLLAALVCGFFVWFCLNINNLEQDQKFYTRTVGNHVQDYLKNCHWYLQHFTRHFPEPALTLANKDFLGSSLPLQQDLFTLFAPALLLAVSFLAALLAFLGLVTFIFDRKLQVQVVTPLAAFTSAIEELKHGENVRAIPENKVSNADSGNFAELSMLQNRFLEMQSAIKKREEDLIKSEEEMFSIYEAANNVAFVKTDCQGKESRILVFSPGAEHIFGYSAGDVLGSPVSILHKKEGVERFPEVIESMRKNKKGFSGESMLIRKNGEEFPALFDTHPVFDGHGNLVATIGVSIDITSRKQAEQQLHNEREKLFITLRSIGDGVITTDSEGRVSFINNVAEQLTGWNQQEASGQPLSEVFHIINEKTGLTCENPVNKVLDSGKIINLANHTALIARDGTRHSIADSGAPILDSQGKIIGVVLVFRDVTQEKKREEELLKIEKLESVGVLAGGIAHDFNNILAAILGNINLAEIYIEKKNKAHPLLKKAEKASIRAKDLTQQLLTFSKGGDPVRETASITQVITDSADFVIHGSNVRCRYAIPEDLWLVDIDTGQMSQVIQNLVINACHAMPEGGEINISCVNIADSTRETGLNLPGEKHIKITIADNGCGIPEKYLDKIFDPYFSTRQEGSGLGLAVTHSIINKHDGHIFVRSKSGKGTIFTIYLPASAEQISSDPGEEAQKPAKTVKGTILVMDDEQMIQDVAKEMLSRFGHEVLQAKDGEEAITIFRERFHSDHPVDVIIMDLTIPGGMGGKDAIKEILKINPDARAIVSSGYSNDPVMANCRQYGFKEVLGKPFEMSQLKETINSVLG